MFTVIDNEEILALNKIELYGSKIAALIGRTTARDLFDVYQMIDSNIIDDSEKVLLKKCSIFYLITSNDYQSIKELISEFNKNLNDMNFNNIRRNLIPMLKVGNQIDVEMYKSTVKDYMDNLFELDDNEKEFVTAFNKGVYSPKLLFDYEISNRILKHPMALWKVQMYGEIK